MNTNSEVRNALKVLQENGITVRRVGDPGIYIVKIPREGQIPKYFIPWLA